MAVGMMAAGVALAAAAVTAAPAAEVALARFEQWLEGARTLTCRFEQRLVAEFVGETQREEGILYLVRPGRMRWEYVKPERKIAVATPERAFIYLPQQAQWIEGGDAWKRSPLWRLLSGETPVAGLFRASLVATPEGGGEGMVVLRLVPRQPLEGVVYVTLRLAPPAMRLVSAEVLDEAGNRVEYRFRRIRTGVHVDERLFEMEPPAGVEILEAG